MRVAAVMAMIACLFVAVASAASTAGIVTPGQARGTAGANLQAATLKRLSLLDQKAFERSLPQLRQAMEQLSPQAAMGRETMTLIAGKLRRTAESTPDYWPTVLRYLQFASSRMAPDAPPPGQKPKALSEILFVGIMRGIREEKRTILFDSDNLGNGVFLNCRVIFTQSAVQLQNVSFRNCAFEFPATDAPSQYLRRISRILLASNLAAVSIASL